MKVKCPTCQKEIEWNAENAFRPFCSKRCKLIDLGAWASGEFSIEGDPSTPLDEHASTDDTTFH